LKGARVSARSHWRAQELVALTDTQVKMRAFGLLALGTGIVAIFADPMYGVRMGTLLSTYLHLIIVLFQSLRDHSFVCKICELQG